MAGVKTSDAGRGASVDDPDFAARIRERDAESLEEVVRLYLPQVLRTTRAAGLGPQLAEDVAQDTFITFIEAAPPQSPAGMPGGKRFRRTVKCLTAKKLRASWPVKSWCTPDGQNGLWPGYTS